jgi:hypothetical protein
MNRATTDSSADLAENGYLVLPEVFSAGQIDGIVTEMTMAFARDTVLVQPELEDRKVRVSG